MVNGGEIKEKLEFLKNYVYEEINLLKEKVRSEEGKAASKGSGSSAAASSIQYPGDSKYTKHYKANRRSCRRDQFKRTYR